MPFDRMQPIYPANSTPLQKLEIAFARWKAYLRMIKRNTDRPDFKHANAQREHIKNGRKVRDFYYNEILILSEMVREQNHTSA